MRVIALTMRVCKRRTWAERVPARGTIRPGEASAGLVTRRRACAATTTTGGSVSARTREGDLARLKRSVHHAHTGVPRVEGVERTGRRRRVTRCRCWRRERRHVRPSGGPAAAGGAGSGRHGRVVFGRMAARAVLALAGRRRGRYADVRLHLVGLSRHGLSRPVARHLVLPRHHPPVGPHRGRELGLFLEVFELRVARVCHARLSGVSALLSSLPLAQRVVSVQHRREVARARRVRHAEVRETRQGRRDGIDLVDCVGAVPRRRVVRIRWRVSGDRCRRRRVSQDRMGRRGGQAV